MKKFVALLLAMLLVLANVAALAEDGNDDTTQVVPTGGMTNVLLRGTLPNHGSETEPVIVKTYTITGQADDTGTLSFTEEISFNVQKEAGATNPDDSMIWVGSDVENKNTETVKVDGKTENEIKINFPEWKKAGTYKYTVVENKGTSQGIDYTGTNSTVKVYVHVTWVENETTHKKSLVGKANVFSVDEETKQKNENVENVYELGSLEVTKTVSGNLADPGKPFSIDVTFTKTENCTVKTPISIKVEGNDADNPITNQKSISAEALNTAGTDGETIRVTLRGNGTDKVTFQNIPYNMTYTVQEPIIQGEQENITEEKQEENVNNVNAYVMDTAEYTGNIDENTQPVSIQNYKNYTAPETGIMLETLPYVLIMAIAVMGVAVLTLRKREEY